MDTSKNVLFFLLVLVLYFVFVRMAFWLVRERKQTSMAATLWSLLLFAVLFMLISKVMMKKSESKDGYQLLEITPAKKCIGGPYMWGDVNSPTYKYCSDPKNQQAIKDASCCVGFVGMPVRYTYTPESDAQWQNPRCHLYGSGHVDGVGA